MALPAGVDLAAYRIVQEGLTNTHKHAGPARAGVAVRYEPDALELEITDDGRAGANGGGGHGRVGMRERVALYGGRLEAGPRPEGGFTIHTHLPLHATASAAQSSPLASSVAERVMGPQARPRSWLKRHAFDVLVSPSRSPRRSRSGSPRCLDRSSSSSPRCCSTRCHSCSSSLSVRGARLAFAVQAAVSFSADAVGSVSSGFAAMLLAFWAVGAQEEARHAVAGVALGFTSLAVAVQWDVRLDYSDLLNGIVLGGATALAAFVLERRARRAVALEERAVRLEEEREERERVAVAEERRRMRVICMTWSRTGWG